MRPSSISRVSRSLLALFAIATFIVIIPSGKSAQQSGRQQKQDQTPPPQGSQQPVRISTQLVQIDAVVTDKKGEHVEVLNEDDFDLTVDGKRQTLNYFKFVKLPDTKSPEASAATPKSSKDNVAPPTMPNKALAREDIKRTIAFVVDDLGLSFESTYYARRALKKFVDEQMQDGDLVAIIRTGRGLGALQQYTGDKRVLYAAIDKLSWNPNSRNMAARFSTPDPTQTQEAREAEERFEDFRETVFSVGTLGALNFVVRSLRELPGRKVAILISDGFNLFGRNRDNTEILNRVRRLTDLANRSSVVIYSIDARGLQTLQPTAADNIGGLSTQQMNEQRTRASQENFDSQGGLSYLANETGGFAVLNNNDVNFGIRKALRDAQSYYLLGFDPEDEKFDRKYHKIRLKVNRPGMQVRTRAGFIGVADAKKPEVPANQLTGTEARDTQILSALFSPFGARDLSLQMTSLFFNEEKQGYFIRSLFHIDSSKLSFIEHPQNKANKLLKIEIVSFTFDENGRQVEQFGRGFDINFDQEQYKLVVENGLIYSNDFLIKKPGAYQLRTVLRDPDTGKMGSAGQFIQVPDLTKKRLALSGLIIAGSTQKEDQDINISPALRRFKQNGLFDYGAVAYNAALDPQTGKPKLMMQVEFYRDGKVIYQSEPKAVEMVEGAVAGTTVHCQGRFRLNGFPTGDYMMHLIVTDPLAKQKYARAEQWMDFSVR